MGRFRPQGQGRQHVGAKVHRQDLRHGQGQGDAEQHEGQVGHQFRDVGGEDVGEELADVLVHRPAFLDGGDDGGEVVVQQHQVRRLPGHVGAAPAHGHADVGGAQGGGVVDAVAGHRDGVALGLERLHQDEFLVGGEAGEHHLGPVQGQLQLGGGQAAQFLAGHDPGMLAAHQADPTRHRQGGAGVVAGDHDHPDARLVALPDGRRHLGPGWIGQAHQAGEDQVALPVFPGFALRQGPPGQGQYPQAPFGQARFRRQGGFPVGGQQGSDPVAGLDAGTQGEQCLQGALAEQEPPFRGRVDGGHALAVGVERQFVQLLKPGPGLAQAQQGFLHGVAEEAALRHHPLQTVAVGGDVQEAGGALRRGLRH